MVFLGFEWEFSLKKAFFWLEAADFRGQGDIEVTRREFFVGKVLTDAGEMDKVIRHKILKHSGTRSSAEQVLWALYAFFVRREPK